MRKIAQIFVCFSESPKFTKLVLKEDEWLPLSFRINSTNQFLDRDFFCHFLQHNGSSKRTLFDIISLVNMSTAVAKSQYHIVLISTEHYILFSTTYARTMGTKRYSNSSDGGNKFWLENFCESTHLHLALLSSEDFNSKEGVTMYFLIHCGHFSNKIALLHF